MYKFAINRPITTLMGVMVFIIFGLMSYRSMPVNLFPNVDFPVVSIRTLYPGADASTVETKVTDKLEEALSTIDGIKKLKSTSYDNFSLIIIQFELSKDLDEGTNDIRDKIGSVLLPNEVKKPIVRKLGTGGDVITLFVASKDGDSQKLMSIVDNRLKPRLQRIKGVGAVDILGYRDREIKIFLNPNRLNKYGLSASELKRVIASSNISVGVGKIVTTNKDITIKLKSDAKSVDELRELIVKPGVKLKDIANIVDGLSDIDSFSSFNNSVGVSMVVKKVSGENSLEIIKKVKEVLPKLKSVAGENYTIIPIADRSDKILINMEHVTFDLIYGSILSIIIVFIFLRSATITLVSAIAIPTSVIGTFAIMNWLGYDLNRLTMIGLTLAIGIFIDDAIVVVENIAKKIEHGVEPFKASFEGIKEIAFSILAISSMLLAVFIPVAFMDGIVGLFFNSFAMTVASGIILSFLVATMLIPSVSARVLNGKVSWFYNITEDLFVKLENGYAKILKYAVKFRYITMFLAVALLLLSVNRFKVGMDFLPMEDNSEFRVLIKAPIGTNIEQMQRLTKPILNKLQSDKNIVYTILSIGYTSAKEQHKAKVYIKLAPKEKRVPLTQEDIMKRYRELFKKIKGLDIVVEDLPPFEKGSSNAPVQVVITGDNLETLGEISLKLMDKMKSIKGLVDIDRDFEYGKPQIEVKILKESAKRLGVNPKDIADILLSSYSSSVAISHYQEKGKEYDITMRLSDKFRDSVDALKSLQVRSKNGNLVALDGLIEIKKIEKLSSINRYDRERKVMVTAGLDGVSLDSVMKEIERLIKPILPKGYSYRFTGDIENMQDTAKAFAGAVILAVVLIYLILASLYESLIQPIIIMVAMPLSVTGVLMALYFSGNNFSLFVMIGIIMLLGMVGKNAILVVDYANRALKEGYNIDSATINAGQMRLRPILMTTFAMIGAMIPLAFSKGAGYESNSPMALAIIGGMISSTILSLFVVPAFYRILYPLDRWFRKWYEKGKV